MVRLLGLIGYPLGHSFSKRYFTERFSEEGITDVRYENFPIECIEELEGLVREHPQLEGFNVTIPYKQQIFRFIDRIDPEAEAIGAVNCVKITRGVKQPTRMGDGICLEGHNTDAYGFDQSLTELLACQQPRALVLGTGGASRAVMYVLEKRGIDYLLVSRKKGVETATPLGTKMTVAYQDITPQMTAERQLIVNTTPLGMYPHTDAAPLLPYDAVGPQHFLFDLVYNPAQTLFMQKGELQGARVMNGMTMLIRQAERSREIYGI